MNSLSMHVVDVTTKKIKKTRRLILDRMTTSRVVRDYRVYFENTRGEKSARAEILSRIRLRIVVGYVLRASKSITRGHATGAVLEAASSLLVSVGLWDRWYARAFSSQSFSPANTRLVLSLTKLSGAP